MLCLAADGILAHAGQAMNALRIFAALITAPFLIVKIARDYEQWEVFETVVGYDPDFGQEHKGGWTRVDADKSPSGEVEYTRRVSRGKATPPAP